MRSERYREASRVQRRKVKVKVTVINLRMPSFSRLGLVAKLGKYQKANRIIRI